MTKLEKLENSLRNPEQINIMHRIDNVLFSHGRLTTEFIKWLDGDLVDADIDGERKCERLYLMLQKEKHNCSYKDKQHRDMLSIFVLKRM